MIRRVTQADAPRLAEMYNHYIQHSIATFETEPLPAEAMWQRVEATTVEGYPYWVCELDGRVVGYAYLGRWKERWCGIGHWILYPHPAKAAEGSCACGAHLECRCD